MTITTPLPGRRRSDFLSWFRNNQSRFQINLEVEPQTRDWIKFSFESFHPALRGQVADHGILVEVQYADVFWDFIFDVEVAPTRVKGGYICSSREEHSRRLFVDRQALLTDSLFEPFLAWVNEKLAPAKWLVLNGDPARFTMATLMIDQPAQPEPSPDWVTHILPLRSPVH